MAEITSQGITIKTLSEWKAALEAIYTAVDPEWNIDTHTPDGQIIAATAEMLANSDEAQLDSYNAADPDKATGQALDAIMRLSDVERRAGTFSTATVQLSGIQNTVVPAGTLIENAVTGTKWATDAEVTIGASATNAAVTCQTIGAQTAGIGELTKIATPVTGLESVTNAAGATPGLNPMTDAEARLFRDETISKPAANAIDAIYAAVASVEGVTHVATYNNRTAAADGNGIPAHNIAVIVAGGTDADVAEAIYSKLPPGPGMHGGTNAVNQAVTSETTGNQETVTFGRPTAVPLYIEVRVKELQDIPDSVKNDIKDALEKFAVGDLFDQDNTPGYRKQGFRIGEDVSSGMLYTPCNYIVGPLGRGYVDEIRLGTAPSPAGPSTVSIGWEQLATIDAANVVVTFI